MHRRVTTRRLRKKHPPQPVSLHSSRWSAWWVGTSILLSVTEGFAMDSLQGWGRHLKCLLFSKNLFLHGIHTQCLQEDTGQFPYKGTPSFLTIEPLCHSQRAHPHLRIESTKRLMLFARGPSYVKVGESLKLYVSRCERAKPVPCPASWTGSKGYQQKLSGRHGKDRWSPWTVPHSFFSPSLATLRLLLCSPGLPENHGDRRCSTHVLGP